MCTELQPPIGGGLYFTSSSSNIVEADNNTTWDAMIRGASVQVLFHPEFMDFGKLLQHFPQIVSIQKYKSASIACKHPSQLCISYHGDSMTSALSDKVLKKSVLRGLTFLNYVFYSRA